METIRVRFLAEFLNDMVAAERTAVAMYRYTIARTADEAFRQRLSAQQADASQHERILVDLIGQLAGEVGPAGVAVRARLAAIEASLAVPVEAGLREWLDIQALLEVETLCWRNWEVLGAIGGANGDPAIGRAVSQVGDDETRHVKALRDALVEQAPEVMLSR